MPRLLLYIYGFASEASSTDEFGILSLPKAFARPIFFERQLGQIIHKAGCHEDDNAGNQYHRQRQYYLNVGIQVN
ncbi:MAG: hypothetical protein PHF50_02400 [Patescibacteria group bacterium]|nr:hypothetical protein [Patescibacteria group bacterium]